MLLASCEYNRPPLQNMLPASWQSNRPLTPRATKMAGHCDLEVEYLHVREPQVLEDLQVDGRQLVGVDVFDGAGAAIGAAVGGGRRLLRHRAGRGRHPDLLTTDHGPVALQVGHGQPLVVPLGQEVGVQGDAEVLVVDLSKEIHMAGYKTQNQ